MKKVRVYLIIEIIIIETKIDTGAKLTNILNPVEVNEYINELTGETKYFKVGKCGNLEFMKTSTFLELKKQTEQSFTPDK